MVYNTHVLCNVFKYSNLMTELIQGLSEALAQNVFLAREN